MGQLPFFMAAPHFPVRSSLPPRVSFDTFSPSGPCVHFEKKPRVGGEERIHNQVNSCKVRPLSLV